LLLFELAVIEVVTMSVPWQYCSLYMGLVRHRRRGTRPDWTTYPCPPTGTVRQISLNVVIYLGFSFRYAPKSVWRPGSALIRRGSLSEYVTTRSLW